MSNEINDIREPKELRVQSFSLYKKSDVKKQLTLSIVQGNIEQSFYWSAELVCSGAFMDLWETIILIISKWKKEFGKSAVFFVILRML